MHYGTILQLNRYRLVGQLHQESTQGTRGKRENVNRPA